MGNLSKSLCNLFNYKGKKDDLRKPIFILYCHKCKIYFTDDVDPAGIIIEFKSLPSDSLS